MSTNLGEVFGFWIFIPLAIDRRKQIDVYALRFLSKIILAFMADLRSFPFVF